MPSRPKTTLLEECRKRDLMPPPGNSITKDIVSLRKKHRAHEAWLDKVAEDSVKYLEVPSAQGPSAQGPSAQGPSAGLKLKKTKRRRIKRRNPTKKKKKKKPTKKR